jgi:restriction system protein
MQFKMAPNSLFAILLRNPWWVSFLLAAVVSLVCAVLLPENWRVFGVLSTFPFWITGLVALKRQWGKPTAAAQQAELARIAGLSWRDFSKELVAKFESQGYAVERLNDGAADFRLSKSGQTTLVAAKRYKAASHGMESLQALVALKEAQGADKAVYVCIGELSEQAQRFAQEHRVEVGVWN